MNERMYYDIISAFLEDDNKKINYNWTLDEFLNTFTNKNLTKSAVTYFWNEGDFSRVFEIRNMANKKKSYIIDYLKENIVGILSVYIKILSNDYIKQLRKLIKYNGCISYNMLQQGMFNLHFLGFLKNNIFARVYLDKKEKTVNIYMPNEFVKIIDEALNDKKIMKINKEYNKIYDFTNGCVDAYGVLTIEELNTLCNKFNFKIDNDELIHIISSYTMVDDGFLLHSFNQKMLVCNLEFPKTDDAFDFYESISDNLNLKLSLKDIEDIKNDKYIHKLKSYTKLINWLDDMFEGIKEDSEFLDSFIISDYIFSAQRSLEVAERNFRNNIDEVIELDPIEKNVMANILKDIYSEYPKWNKRGNI